MWLTLLALSMANSVSHVNPQPCWHDRTMADEEVTTPRRHRWRWVVGGIAVVLVLVVAGGAAFVLWPRRPTPITEDDALDEFRGGTVPGVGPSAGPAPGVYTYDAVGTESIDMGPVPLPERTIPSTVTLVVQPADGACWSLDLNLMAEHTETTRACREADGGLSLPSQTKAVLVPGFRVGITNACDPAVVLSPTAADLPLACRETFDVSGLVLAVDLEGTATSEPGGPMTVEGRAVDTVHLHIDLTGTGDLEGHSIEDWWVTTDGLPVRMERDIDLDGPGHFVERSTLTLRSVTPRT
jgi:hypothetical protein